MDVDQAPTQETKPAVASSESVPKAEDAGSAEATEKPAAAAAVKPDPAPVASTDKTETTTTTQSANLKSEPDADADVDDEDGDGSDGKEEGAEEEDALFTALEAEDEKEAVEQI